MKWTKKFIVEVTIILAMTAVVLILAFLQYRWTGEISATEQVRLEAELGTSVKNFSQEFSYDLERLCESFEIDPEAPAETLETRVIHNYLAWESAAPRPGMVEGLQIWKLGGDGKYELESFDPAGQRFQKAAFSARLEPLHEFLKKEVDEMLFYEDDRDAMYFPWTIFEQMPALIRPLYQISPNRKDTGMEIEPIGILIVEFSPRFLTETYLPELVDRHFGTLDQRTFGVIVRSAKAPYQTVYPVYPSDHDVPVLASSPDATVNLFELVGEEARRRGHPQLQDSSKDRQWQLIVQHPAGSLQVAVAAWRRRNLAISLGLLAVLAGSMSLIFFLARRADSLARFQMEFVAGVSHELCTPLAIINSAAENLADGVVDGPAQVGEYGSLIRDQGRRLEHLVDEVLLFASGRRERPDYGLRPIEIAPIVAQSLVQSEPMLRDAGFSVEKEISANLPLVVADPAAILTCLENLVSNAMKYGGTNRWVAVRARVAAANPRPEVQISVEDKGIGISSGDLPNIFDPFYRVQAVRDGQIRGVGLGLYLVKRMMESMGGRVSVSSELGRGTFFILHFPVAGPAAHGQG